MKRFSRTSDSVIFRPLMALVIMLSLQPGLVRCQDLPFHAYMGHPWVDSVLSSLSTTERMAQSIFISSGPDRDFSHYLLIDKLIREYGIGGLVVRPRPGNSFVDRAETWGQLPYFRSASRVPLAVAMEGGGMYSKGEGYWPGSPAMKDLPGPWTLAAAGDERQAGKLGDILSRQYRQMGAQMVVTPATGIPLSQELQDRFEENRVLLWTEDRGMEGITVIDGDDEEDRTLAKIASLLEKVAADTMTVNRRARQVLAFKYWAGLNGATEGPGAPEEEAVNDPGTRALVRDIYANSLVLLRNQGELVPLMGLENLKVACISLAGISMEGEDRSGQGFMAPFQEMAANYTRMDQYDWHPGMQGQDRLQEQLSAYDVVLAGVYPGAVKGEAVRKTGAGDLSFHEFLSGISDRTKVITVLFGQPENYLSSVPPLESASLILALRQNAFTEGLAAQLIFGGIGARGKLPRAIGNSYAAGVGITTGGGLRLQYAYPEDAGLSSFLLNHKIDSVVGEGLEAGAFPGCEVIAARDGKVIFHKTYGYQTYNKRSEVRKEDLYDLASVTKVSGPLSGLMLLEGRGMFSHKDQLGKYVPSMRGSDKADLPLKDILAHQAGLVPGVPYWKQTFKKNGNFKRRLVSYNPSDKYDLVMADHLYLKDSFLKKIYRAIRKSELGEKEYLYSGLSFFLYPGIIEELSGKPYEDFLYENIYRKLGAWDLVFNPLRFYPPARIAPTEFDSLFRWRQIHGYVHDENAATMGGFSGNAGLFATAGDLLKLIEMYRRMGSYGGEQIIPEEVLKEYTSYQFPEKLNRRGLGFDKPLLDERDGTPGDYPCPGASPSSFGHSGYTGTFVWADPEYGISYVFLSNRVYPTRRNNLIAEMNIRTEVLQAIYDSITDDSPVSGGYSK
jgi:beta-N-acetylhexosaminidase